MGLPGLAGGPDLGFGFPWNGGIPHPHQAAWSQPINRCPKGNKGNMRESGKARECLSLNKSPWKFVPIKLLCKHVTNLLKPATNCLCSPSWGSGLSDPAALHWMQQEPWLESVINFPFLRVALSWKPSLFPLGDSDIGQNRYAWHAALTNTPYDFMA